MLYRKHDRQGYFSYDAEAVLLLQFRCYAAMIKACDALIIVAPEYNGGYAPVLKNAIDFLYKEWAGMASSKVFSAEV